MNADRARLRRPRGPRSRVARRLLRRGRSASCPATTPHTWRNDGKAHRVIVQQGSANDAAFVGFEARDERRLRRAPSPGCARAGFDIADGDARRTRERAAPRPHRPRRGACRSRSSSASPTRRRRSRRRSCPAASSPKASASATPCSPRTAFDESHRFLTEGLGLGQSDWLEMEIAAGIELEVRFYHCNAPAPHRGARQGAVRAAADAAPPHVRDQRARRRRRRVRPRLGDRPAASRTASAATTTTGCSASTCRARPASRSRSATAPRSSATTGTATARYDRISAWGHQPLRAGVMTDADVADRRLRAGRQRAGDPARPARPARSTVLERWPEPYPLPRAVHFDHEVGRILQSCGIGDEVRAISEPAEVYEWRNAAGTTLLRFGQAGRRTVGMAGVVDVQPAGGRAAARPIGPRELGVDVRRGVEVTAVDQRDDHVVVAAPTARPCRRATSSGATAPTARCGRWLDLPVDRPRVLLRLAHRRRDPRRAARVRSDQPADLRPGPTDDGGVGRSRPAALGVHAPAARVARRAATTRSGRGSCSRRGTCTPATPGSSATPSTRSTPATPSGGAPGACSSPATPPTSCRRSPARACAPGLRDAANLAWKLDLVLDGLRRRRAARHLPVGAAAEREGGDRVLDGARQGDLRARPGRGRGPRRGHGRRRRRRPGRRPGLPDIDARVHPPDRAARRQAARAGQGRRPPVRRGPRQRLAARRPGADARARSDATSAPGSSRSAARSSRWTNPTRGSTGGSPSTTRRARCSDPTSTSTARPRRRRSATALLADLRHHLAPRTTT